MKKIIYLLLTFCSFELMSQTYYENYSEALKNPKKVKHLKLIYSNQNIEELDSRVIKLNSIESIEIYNYKGNVFRYDKLTDIIIQKIDKEYIVCFDWGKIKGFPLIHSFRDLVLFENSSGVTIYRNQEVIKTYPLHGWYFHMTDRGYLYSYEDKFCEDLNDEIEVFNLIDFVNDKIILDESVPYRLEYSKGIIIGCDDSKKKLVRLNKDTSLIWEYDLSKELPKASYDEDEDDCLDKFIGIF